MKSIKIIFTTIFSFSLFMLSYTQTSIHEFKTQTIEGEEFDLAQLRGKKVLIVNTASKCGLTGQYEELQDLYNRYKDKNFIIIAFPANNFLNQEPGSNEEIKDFCERNYGVTFPVMTKISVKGRNIDPIYEWLTKKEKNGVTDAEVTWNFQKFMIDENGFFVDFLAPRESPLSEKIINWINAEE
ncbi:MAG: glutathione peroxidase [Bacteroidales bacterium]|nr:glutathione peroxidase [Bacteroidales bacterium]